jgi:hypothetical protein
MQSGSGYSILRSRRRCDQFLGPTKMTEHPRLRPQRAGLAHPPNSVERVGPKVGVKAPQHASHVAALVDFSETGASTSLWHQTAWRSTLRSERGVAFWEENKIWGGIAI